MKKTLWDHQKKAVKVVCTEFETEDRALVVMAPGTGKSRVIYETILKLKADRVIVAVPTRALVRQFIQSLEEWGCKHKVLAVCAQGTVEGDSDNTPVVGATTHTPDIRAFWSGKGKKIVVTTYTSSKFVKDANMAVDLVTFDEAHHCASARFEDAAKKRAQHLMDDSKGFKAKKRMFFTATPKVYHKKSRDGLNVVGMESAKLFGRQVFDFSYAEALALEIVKEFVVHIVAYESDPKKDWIIPRNYALAACFAGHPDELRGLAFNSTIENAAHISKVYETLAPGKTTQHIDCGVHSPEARQQALQDLVIHGGGLLSNVNAFGEGVDSPQLNAVVFADPKYSDVGIVQAAGRGWRKDHSRPDERCHIFIPVMHESDGVFDSKSMEPVQEILKNLAIMDSGFMAELHAQTTDDLREEGSRSTRLDITGNLPKFKLKEILDRIAVTTITGEDYAWQANFDELKAMYERGEEPQVESSLNKWIKVQRSLYHGTRRQRKPMSQDRISMFESLGPWVWDAEPNRKMTNDEVIRFLQKNSGKPGSWPAGSPSYSLIVGRFGSYKNARKIARAGVDLGDKYITAHGNGYRAKIVRKKIVHYRSADTIEEARIERDKLLAELDGV